MSDLVFQHCPLRVDEIPAGWELTALSAFVTEVQTGFASGDHNSDGQGVPHLRPMNITPNGAIDLTDLRSVAPEANILRLRRGDVLFNNTNSPVWVGKTAYIDTDIELAFSNHMTRIRAPEEIDARFLAKQIHFLCTSGYFQYQCKKHVNQASINRSFLAESTPFLLPPPGEQRRIVAKIEALQERSRKAREALAEVGPLLEQFRQSLLAAAYRGDLTADWRAANPNVEPASELFNRIRQERRRHWEESEQAKFEKKNTKPKNDNWKEKYPESQPFKFDGELPEIPQTWEWTNWDSLTMWVTYGFTRPMPHVEMGPMIVTAKNVRNEGLRLDVVDHTTEEAFAELNPKDLPIPGDILIIKDGATTGRAALVPDGIGEFCINQSVGVIWLKYSPMHRLFLLRWVQSPLIQRMIQEAMSGMAMPHLSVTDFKAMPVPIPPLEEQLAICEALEFGLGTADSLRASTFESELELAQLDQSILAKAFRGELVPQDPNDEPASELLARIRRMRETSGRQKNSGPGKATKSTKRKSSST